jgi:hypothetical protein
LYTSLEIQNRNASNTRHKHEVILSSVFWLDKKKQRQRALRSASLKFLANDVRNRIPSLTGEL